MKSTTPETSKANDSQFAIPPLEDRPDIDHPLVYADQIASISITAFTSRITLAVEQHARGQREPVITLVMPTASLHAMAQVIIANVGSPEQQEMISQNFADYQNSVKISKPLIGP